jgi:metal-responsive CopG/Arc/MetJ family transcriptional regulator
MRTIVDLPASQVEALDSFCRREGISRAEAVRRAVGEHLERHRADRDRAFGLWRTRRVDSLEYQRALRSEWDPTGGR